MLADVRGRDGRVLLGADAGRETVDRVATLERRFDDYTGRTHALNGVAGQLDPFPAPRHAYDLVEGEIPAGEHDGQAGHLI